MTKTSLPVTGLVFLAALLVGGATGYGLGKRGEPAPVVAEEEAEPAAGVAGPDPEGAQASDAVPRELAELATEIGNLRLRAAGLRKRLPQARTREQKLAFARELLELVKLATETQDPALRDRYSLLIPELEPDMAVVFAEALRSGEAPSVEVVTWMLLECGGPEASEWVLGLLDRDPLDPLLRPVEQACEKGVSPFGFSRFAVEGALFEKVRALVASPSDGRRFHAIGLLAFSDTRESRELLRGIVESDPSSSRRMLALNSLSKIATSGTRDWFEAWVAGLPEAEKEENESRLRRARRNIERRLAR